MILFSGGTIVDGTGKPAWRGDVLVRNGIVAEVGAVAPSPEMEVVECSGLVVTPGFIDVHSHSDLEALEHRSEKTRQGVTTEVVGNCGFSLFPAIPSSGLVPSFNIFNRRGDRKWVDAADYFDNVDQAGSRTNIAALTGHATLRAHVAGMRAGKLDSASEQELHKELTRSLEQGAKGLSTGLNEVPSSYGDFEELAGLCRIAQRYGALYTSHLRDYKFRFLEAVQEALDLGRQTQVPVELSHLQAVGRKNWHKMSEALELVEQALRDGVQVGIDAYPYVAGSAHLTQALPTWALEGGTASLLGRLSDPATRARIADETEAGMSNTWADVVIAGGLPEAVIGKTVQQVADERGCSGIDAALDLVIEAGGPLRIISFNQSEENLRKVLTHPLTAIITDGLVTEGKCHPRAFGTYPTFLGKFIREKRWLTLEEAIRKITSLPARRFSLERRGTLERGGWADITVFDSEKIGTRSDYLEPDHRPEGITHVLVNGIFVIRDGELIEDRHPGVPLRHRGQ